jgi:hypothetical protein
MIRTSIGLLCALCVTSVGAADRSGKYMAVGESCGTFVRDFARPGPLRNQSESWVNGYITAYNLLSNDTYDIRGGTDIDSLMLWLDNHCRQHPLDSLSAAMRVLVDELFPRRKTTAP